MIQLHLKVKNLVNLETMEHSMAHHEETNFWIKLWYKLVGTQGNWCPHFPKRKYIWYNMSRCFESSLKYHQLKPISYWISRLKNHKLYGLQRMNTRWTSFIYFLTSKAGNRFTSLMCTAHKIFLHKFLGHCNMPNLLMGCWKPSLAWNPKHQI